MEGRRYKRYRRGVAAYEAIVEAILSVGVGLVLWLDPGDCSKPLRLWLEGILGCFVLHICARLVGGRVHTIVEYGLPVVVLGWIGIGSLWLLSIDQCATFPSGYALCWSLLGLYWSMLGLTCLQGLFILVLSWKRRHVPAESSSTQLDH